jgi:hypothetical protein
MCLKVSKNPKKITNPSAPLKNLRSHQQYIRSFYNWCISEAWHCTPGSEFFTVHLTWGLFLPRPEMSKRQLATSVFLHGGAVLEIWSFIGQWLWKTSRSPVVFFGAACLSWRKRDQDLKPPYLHGRGCCRLASAPFLALSQPQSHCTRT